MLTGEGRQMTSQKQSYNKSFLDIDAQISLLKSRGMLFQDENQAKKSLLNLNYYRLSGYWSNWREIAVAEGER
jgi:abortive infection bacteriophage resistance protein